ncbi:hypothetical protein Tco_1294935 [Tanacetum coccineum]
MDDSEVDRVSESICMHGNEFTHGESNETDPTYPPGFTLDLENNGNDKRVDSTSKQDSFISRKEYVIKSNKDSQTKRSASMATVGGSILEVMDDLVKVGQTMGYKMDGCLKNIEEIIGSQGDCNIFK